MAGGVSNPSNNGPLGALGKFMGQGGTDNAVNPVIKEAAVIQQDSLDKKKASDMASGQLQIDQAAKDQMKKNRGLAATMLTGGQGLLDKPYVSAASLLGS